jgi:hypothetical protein
MQKSFFVSPLRLLAALLAVCLMAAAHAQSHSAKPAAATPPTAQSAKVSPALQANNELLSKAAALYYSTTKAGLSGFDCAVHSDWRAIFASVDKGTEMPADDPRFAMLNAIKITLHARLKGGSTVEWTPPAADPNNPIDPDSGNMLDGMHQSVDQTLNGFLQFWTPFVNGSIVPDSANGLEITPTPEGGYKVYAEQGGTKLKEIFDKDLVLQLFSVDQNGTKIEFSPTFKSTEKGLLVTKYLAHIAPAGTPGQVQEMHVNVEYQVVDGFQIPSSIGMEVVNSATLNFTLNGCTVTR